MASRSKFPPVFRVAYLAYIPAILLLLATKSFSGIAAAMLCIGFAAGRVTAARPLHKLRLFPAAGPA